MALSTRDTRPELMDAGHPSASEVAGSLRFLRAINRWLGGVRVVTSHLARRPPRTVLDVAAGAADIPQAVARRFDARVVALDVSREVLAFARSEVRDPRIRFVRGDALRLPFRPGAFDAAVSSLFAHHLTDAGVARLLGEMNRVAGTIVVNDLIRRSALLAWTYFFTSLSTSRLVRVDGPLSVRRAFTPGEFAEVSRRAGCGHLRVHQHPGHRMAMAGTRRTARGT